MLFSSLLRISQALLSLPLVLTVIFRLYKTIVLPIRTAFIHNMPSVEMGQKKDNLKVILKQQQQITSQDSPLLSYLEPLCQGVTKKSQQYTEVLLCIESESDLLNSKT